MVNRDRAMRGADEMETRERPTERERGLLRGDAWH